MGGKNTVLDASWCFDISRPRLSSSSLTGWLYCEGSDLWAQLRRGLSFKHRCLPRIVPSHIIPLAEHGTGLLNRSVLWPDLSWNWLVFFPYLPEDYITGVPRGEKALGYVSILKISDPELEKLYCNQTSYQIHDDLYQIHDVCLRGLFSLCWCALAGEHFRWPEHGVHA